MFLLEVFGHSLASTEYPHFLNLCQFNTTFIHYKEDIHGAPCPQGAVKEAEDTASPPRPYSRVR